MIFNCRCAGKKVVFHHTITETSKVETFSSPEPASLENGVIFRKFQYFPVIVRLWIPQTSTSGIYSSVTRSSWPGFS